MNYRHLGRSGLQVSELSLGAWVTAGSQVDEKHYRDSMAAAYEYGVNFFDNAEVYATGRAGEAHGRGASKKLGWRRETYSVSTKVFWGGDEGPNRKARLTRKHVTGRLHAALKRLELDYVDLVLLPSTPTSPLRSKRRSGPCTTWSRGEEPSTRVPPNGRRADHRPHGIAERIT